MLDPWERWHRQQDGPLHTEAVAQVEDSGPIASTEYLGENSKFTSRHGIDCGINLTVGILKALHHEDTQSDRQGSAPRNAAVTVRTPGVWRPSEPVFVPS